MRAQIALMCHAGASTTAIAESVGVSVQTVSHWRTRLARQGIKGLDEVARGAETGPARGSDQPCRASRSAPVAGAPLAAHWLAGLEQDARNLLLSGQPEVWDTLTRKFEAQLIHTALEITRGRRIEAAQKLGIGRNTITRKIQELGLDD